MMDIIKKPDRDLKGQEDRTRERKSQNLTGNISSDLAPKNEAGAAGTCLEVPEKCLEVERTAFLNSNSNSTQPKETLKIPEMPSPTIWVEENQLDAKREEVNLADKLVVDHHLRAK
ncbi:hypothetical protein L6452_41168 [Arctium lappa]|uniref:Uncharacterized protein n=1 Tax=Arctium lappa TaxID=4217 RepID=A0ACB8XNH6_ARCLA|nr:hypothetical protein L6452_41168 [Arctium lappa]